MREAVGGRYLEKSDILLWRVAPERGQGDNSGGGKKQHERGEGEFEAGAPPGMWEKGRDDNRLTEVPGHTHNPRTHP